MKTRHLLWGLLALALGGGIFEIKKVATTPSTAELRAASISAQVNITTTGAFPNKWKMGTNAVDICVASIPRAVETDLSNPATNALSAGLGFKSFCVHGVGDISQYYHFPVGTGTFSGYNFKATDFVSDAAYRSAQGGVGAVPWKDDFATLLLQWFRNINNPPVELCLNIKNGNYKEFDWGISNFHANLLWLYTDGVIDSTYSVDKYTTQAAQAMDTIDKYHPGCSYILDGGLIYRTTNKVHDWEKKVYAAFAGRANVVGGRTYWQGKDQEPNIGLNQDSNIVYVHDFTHRVIQSNLSTFQSTFPGWKMYPGEVQSSDNRFGIPRPMFNFISDVIFWGEIYEAGVSLQASIPEALQMSFKNISLDSTNVYYKTFKWLNGTLDPNNSVVQLSFANMPGVEGYAQQNGRSNILVLINESATAYAPLIYIDGKKKTPSVNMKRLYAQAANATVQTDQINGALSVPGLSVCVCSW